MPPTAVRTEPSPLDIGRLVMTPSAQSGLCREDVRQALRRHAATEWGCLQRQVELALKPPGMRLLSVSTDRKGQAFWIVTESERRVTRVLLPTEYAG